MDEVGEAYKQLLVSLKKTELNYHAHVREFGKLGQQEINFWAEQLKDFTAPRIERAFDEHIKNCSYFPTVKDIRGLNMQIGCLQILILRRCLCLISLRRYSGNCRLKY